MTMLPVNAPSETTPVAVQAFMTAPDEAAIGKRSPGSHSATTAVVKASTMPATSSSFWPIVDNQADSASITAELALAEAIGSAA